MVYGVSAHELKRHHEKHGRKKETKKEVHEMRIRKAESGGYSIEHHMKHKDGGYHEPELHVVKSEAHLARHVKEYFGNPAEDSQEKAETMQPKQGHGEKEFD